jgi:hypothetical protein
MESMAEENTDWFIKAGGVGGETLLLSSTGAPGAECIIDGLPSVSFTLPIPHFSVICYKRTGYSQCMTISLYECQINELAH